MPYSLAFGCTASAVNNPDVHFHEFPRQSDFRRRVDLTDPNRVKAQKYGWKDSNMALFGSDTEMQVKKESAVAESAWKGVGQEPGLKIWRIENFEVKDWDPSVYGEFYNGDSYIVLNTYKDEESEALMHDVHFWIGKNSTQDEYGTAAYKTVELDAFLDDAAVQHREVQGHESALFKSYFADGIFTMEGVAESGFKYVEPADYKPRLLHFSGKGKHVCVREVPCSKNSLKHGDVYILDLAEKFIQYNSDDCNPFERSKAMECMVNLENKRGSSDHLVIDAGQADNDFMDVLNDDEIDVDSDDEEDEDGDKKLYRLNAEGTFDEVKTGDVSRDDFVKEDVFLLDIPNEVFVWIGSAASSEEKRNGLPRAHEYMKTRAKCSTPLTIIREGLKSTTFNVAVRA